MKQADNLLDKHRAVKIGKKEYAVGLLWNDAAEASNAKAEAKKQAQKDVLFSMQN